MKTTFIVSLVAVALFAAGYLLRPTDTPFTGVGTLPNENAVATPDAGVATEETEAGAEAEGDAAAAEVDGADESVEEEPEGDESSN